MHGHRLPRVAEGGVQRGAKLVYWDCAINLLAIDEQSRRCVYPKRVGLLHRGPNLVLVLRLQTGR